MDFSLTLDSGLLAPSCFTSESLGEYFTSSDFDLFGSLSLDPSLVSETIGSFEMTDLSSSASSPMTSLLSPPDNAQPNYTSEVTNYSVAPLCHPPRQQHTSSPSPLSKSRYPSRENHNTKSLVKRHQIKLACVCCRKLGKKCDERRPCGRCVRFSRCSECVDAPPRKSRSKIGERGTYKKTRDLAAVDYQGAVQKRHAYVAKQRRLGRIVKFGLTPDDILEKAMEENAKLTKAAKQLGLTSFTEETPGHGYLYPIAGLSEDLLMCSDSPEKNLDETLISSPTSSVFDASTINVSPLSEIDPSLHVTGCRTQTLEMFPNLSRLIAAARAFESTPSPAHNPQARSGILFEV